jgi:hypothetical protein
MAKTTAGYSAKRSALRCIYCGRNVNGLPVIEDHVIHAVRLFKRNILHNEKGYRLVVCKEDFPKYSKAKEEYQKRQGRLVALGVVFALVLIIFGPDKLTAVLDGIVVIVFTYLISLLGYTPSLQMPKPGRERQ